MAPNPYRLNPDDDRQPPMRRRQVLGALVAGSLGGSAGCMTGGLSSSSPTPDPTTPRPAGRANVSLPVPSEEIYTAVARDQIPAIVDPKFGEDWGDVESPEGSSSLRLDDSAPVVGVERGDTARAYPLAILNWHEVVNDQLGGAILVTYCVLCGSAVVTERRVADEPTVFGVSGKLWRSDLVMYDRRTDSLWSQLLATAIRGPQTGATLPIIPSSLTTWGEWRSSHPSTVVLLPPPASNTLQGRDATFDYGKPKYGYDEETQLIGYDTAEGRLEPKTLVLGIARGSTAIAYPFNAVQAAGGVVNDRVGDRPVVVASTPGGSLVGYDRRIEGRSRRFGPDGQTHMRAAGTRWRRETGRAVDGRHTGARLTPATNVPAMFWTGWKRFHPQTDVYGSERATATRSATG